MCAKIITSKYVCTKQKLFANLRYAVLLEVSQTSRQLEDVLVVVVCGTDNAKPTDYMLAIVSASLRER